MCPSLTSEASQPAPTDVTADVEVAARGFFPELADLEVVPGHPNLARIATTDGLWRVRRWPEGTPVQDVTFSHDVINRSRDAGLTVAPVVAQASNGTAVMQHRGRLYDALRWQPGAPVPRAEAAWPDREVTIDLPAVLTPAGFAQVITAMARLHEATLSMTELPDAPVAPVEMLAGAVQQAQARHRQNLRARARHEPAIQRWLATSERLIAAAEPLLTTANDQALPQTVLHLGLWPGHVLFESERLSGLLGWERSAVGSPLLDIAQAILRLQGWNDEAVEMALASYGEIRSLSPAERRLLPAVAALDAVASTGRLLEQTYSRVDSGRPPTAVRSAIDLMLKSLTALERNLTALETVGKSKRTPWNRSSRPAPRGEGGKRHVRRRRTT
jgi:aminoglycoside phosphotransferase (APT) family kinase protein